MRHVEKNVFVTGAGRGFGRATALGFAREGAAVVYLVDRLREELDAATAEVEALGSKAVAIHADLGTIEGCDSAVREALAVGDHIDVAVINHAYIAPKTAFLDLQDDAWEREIMVNLTGYYALGQRVARAMVARGEGGSILFTASVSALGAGSGFAPYCVSKAGLVSLAQVMAIELARDGIRVNCVSPGPGDTPRSEEAVGKKKMDELRQGFAGVPIGRLVSPDEIAEAFLYLASDVAGSVTGHNLLVDGGLSARIYELPDDD
jgi:NAD(P)-dependent dehydrogenase (short-subunit alcohol dehydrogenase family)